MMAAANRETCPTCGKPATDGFRPFCSRRCKNVDLSRWLSGVYAVPVTADDDEDGTPREPNEPER